MLKFKKSKVLLTYMGKLTNIRNKKNKKGLEKEVEDLYDYDEDSDIVVTEKKTKQKKIRK
jgi:hypothetical protein